MTDNDLTGTDSPTHSFSVSISGWSDTDRREYRCASWADGEALLELADKQHMAAILVDHGDMRYKKNANA